MTPHWIYVSGMAFAAGFLVLPETAWGSCYVPVFDKSARSTKLQQQQQRDLAYRQLLTNNARALKIGMVPNKPKYLPFETPTFTVSISNPTDRPLEIPLPFDRRTSEFSQSTYRENCPQWTAPPAMVLLPGETVTEQVLGQPQYTRHTNAFYVYTYADGRAQTTVTFLETTVAARFELSLAKPHLWTDNGDPRESPRTATVFTLEADGRHLIAFHVYSDVTDIEPGSALFADDFKHLTVLAELDQPIQIVSIAEGPVNTQRRLRFRNGAPKNSTVCTE